MKARDVAPIDTGPAATAGIVDAVAARKRVVHRETIAAATANTVIGVVTLRDLTNVELLDPWNEESS